MTKLEEIKERKNLLLAGILESKARMKALEDQIFPLQQAFYKEQEIQANLRLEYSRNEFKRMELEKPSPETEKLLSILMKQHSLSREFAMQVLDGLRG